MKKIVSLLLGLAFLTFTGCPATSDKPNMGAGRPGTTPMGTPAVKSKEVLDRIAAYKEKWGVTPEKNAQYKPKILVTLTGDLQQADGMTVNPKTKTVFVNFPNFNYRKDDTGPKNHPGILARLKITGDTATAEEILDYEKVVQFPETGQVGPMGMFFGPDGHLYVCDNQYFFNTDWKSRMLRVCMDGDDPTGVVEVVVEGTKLSNAALWVGNRMFVTDTFMDIEGQPQAGCVWAFTLEELSTAGKDGNPPIKLNPIKTGMSDDPHCISLQFVKELPGCGNAGADGLTADKDGNVYFGNFGNGEVYQIVFDADGKAKTNIVHPAGEYFGCCDGIFYYAETNEIYVNDSAANAIHAFTPPAPGAKAVFRTLWENGDTAGADGSLDQPAELVVVDGKMIIANFDWAFPELLNTESSPPNTISVINLK
jgi:sugar lactone lactonase YvrE